jgi:hypothetical protein
MAAGNGWYHSQGSAELQASKHCTQPVTDTVCAFCPPPSLPPAPASTPVLCRLLTPLA